MVDFEHETTTGRLTAATTLSGTSFHADLFVLATGAWTSNIANMFGSALATGQVLGFFKLTQAEMQSYRNLPIYQNVSTGWFCFSPHEETGYLKCAIHGKGHTRMIQQGYDFAFLRGENIQKQRQDDAEISSPSARMVGERKNFTPLDGKRTTSSRPHRLSTGAGQ